ncbi:hypothetical protein [Paraclostridium sp. AKS81]|uniref:hypothetical protein n=1 Tax=Paraclostridium sp. AKS81 TaxID=2876117 RepID=UPI0021E077FC|nr:hypothetical protein [Paraclostridium sp. AKS81]MCU9813034.1 hypothetical protein [Paraclostridium sp. AKS81]
MIKIRKYGYIFMMFIFIIIDFSINFLFKQMDSALKPIEFKDNEIKITHKTYKINNIMDVELLDKVVLSGGILQIQIMEFIRLMEISLSLKYIYIKM